MSRGLPSTTALLAILAVAGYQHRDKLAEMLGGARAKTTGASTDADPPVERSGPLDGLGGMLAGSSIGSIISGGLQDLIGRFHQNGQGEAADSWVARGPNRDIAPDQLERAIGAETLETLSRQTGLSHDEIVARLTRELPSAIDRLTPDGRVPSDEVVPKTA